MHMNTLKINKTKSTLLALGLGLALVLGGCNAAKDATDKGTEMAQKTSDKATEMANDASKEAGDMANKAGETASDMANKAEQTAGEAADQASEAMSGTLSMATETFGDAAELTEASADSFKEKAMTAFTGMQEQFAGIKDKLDENVVQDLQGRFDSLKGKMDGLADKSGTELVSALNEIKTEGAELAAKLKEATGTVTGGDDVAATPAPEATPTE